MSPQKVAFRVGLSLMAMSFLVYLSYSFIPFLPLSGPIKVGIAIGASTISWGLFGLGMLLAGKEGYAYLKKWVKAIWQGIFLKTNGRQG
ncbi:MAG: hypothetical protein HY998_03375 [candidate division NC10 bacterium]|nr:hypothetical protein [candidate division NC10 bacterium]